MDTIKRKPIILAKKALNHYFGYSDFRKEQREIIEKLLSGKDIVAIMATGKGKSLCYQVPSLLFPGLTIVISPLISLMKDQVDKLLQKGISADFINSSLENKELEEKLDKLQRKEYKILYIAPERVNSSSFLEILSKTDVSLFAVDEAHCISQWGHNFRPSYLKIRELINLCRRPAVMALTATATPEVRKDIINNLNLENPEIKVFSFDRENFSYKVKKVRREREKEEILWDILCEEPGCGVIYGGTRKDVCLLAKKLKTWGINGEAYHGGMDTKKRDEIQDRFMNNKLEVVVATNAFGMGIDKPDIRFVVHYTLPGNMEAYYQEIGRAGRDGNYAKAILLFKPSDIYLRKFFIDLTYPSVEKIKKTALFIYKEGKNTVTIEPEKVAEKIFKRKSQAPLVESAIKILEKYDCLEVVKSKREKEGKVYVKIKGGTTKVDYNHINALKEKEKEKLEYMIGYSNTEECRRKFILSYFNEQNLKEKCSSCDNCNGRML